MNSFPDTQEFARFFRIATILEAGPRYPDDENFEQAVGNASQILRDMPIIVRHAYEAGQRNPIQAGK